MKDIANLVPLLCALLLTACGCGGNEHALALAQSLSAPRLDRLANDLNTLRDAHPNALKVFDERTGIPKEFADLRPLAVVVDPVMTRVHLSGCVDDKVQILLRDLEGRHQELVLLKGEEQGQAVLWSK
jgi:hypothetical protein